MASTTWVIFLCTAALAAATDIDFQKSARIVGGTAMTIESFPSILQLEQLNSLNNIWSQYCAGNVLTSRWILSTATCLSGKIAETRVRAGATMRNSGGVVAYLNKVIIHPSYNYIATRTKAADIGVAELRTRLTFSSAIQPAIIVRQNALIPNYLPVVHAGWGYTSENGVSSPVLRRVSVDTIDNAVCASHYRFSGLTVTKDMICSGIPDTEGKGACDGDFGGPMYYPMSNNTIIALSSWGAGCARSYLPGVSISLAVYSDWIAATVLNNQV